MSSIRRSSGHVKPYEAGPDFVGWEQSSPEFRRRLDCWISSHVTARRTASPNTSYGLKHCFERATNCYVTNNVFKAAMVEHGYLPVDPSELNWRFRIRVTGGCPDQRPPMQHESCFKRWSAA